MRFRLRRSAVKAVLKPRFPRCKRNTPTSLAAANRSFAARISVHVGIYYRALIGPFASAEKAAKLCRRLRAAGGDCASSSRKIDIRGLTPCAPAGCRRRKGCQPSLAELLKLHVGIEADFFGGGRVGPRECIRLRPAAFEAISTPCRAESVRIALVLIAAPLGRYRPARPVAPESQIEVPSLCQGMHDHRASHRCGWSVKQRPKILLDPGERALVSTAQLLRNR